MLLEESVWSVVRQENEREDQGEGIQDSGKTGNGVRGRDICMCALQKAQENKLEVTEMRMLRWVCGVTKLDKIRNERIRGTNKVGGGIAKKLQEKEAEVVWARDEKRGALRRKDGGRRK